MLEFEGVVVQSAAGDRLNRLSFTARSGEVLGVVGPTGSGKSTLLEAAAGLISVDRGRITIEGRDATRHPDRLRQAAAWMGHERPGPDDVRVRAWLTLWARLDGVSDEVSKTRLGEAADRFELHSILDRPVHQLSRGQSRRLAISRMWMRQPAVYLLDGPEEGVDGPGLRQLSSAIRTAAAAGATVLCASAAPYFPSTVCDRVICLAEGAVTDTLPRSDRDFSARLAEALGWQP